MKISELDKNFVVEQSLAGLSYLSAQNPVFKIDGIFHDEGTNKYLRMPADIASRVSEGISALNACTSGGRVRFVTDSKTIGISVKTSYVSVMNHMTQVGIRGFALYADGAYYRSFVPPQNNDEKSANEYQSQISFSEKRLREITIYFPLYNDVVSLHIGLESQSEICAPAPYLNKKPIVFYGSSITQGGCASRPGNSYDAVVSRMLNSDYINLGFSGNCKAESVMCEYLTTIDASAVVYDYDHNAPDVDFLKKTHYDFYSNYREKCKDTPLLLLSRPDFELDKQDSILRREVILDTYNRGLKNGDERLFFVDGEKLFGKTNRDCCTVDGCHPNDLGFVRMAEYIFPTLKKMIHLK